MGNQWVRNLFSFSATPRDGLSLQEEEVLVELSSNMDLKQRLGEMQITHFWLSVESEFRQISTEAMKVLIPFTSTYLCVFGFSALTRIKNKYRSRLQVEDDLRLFLSAVQPCIEHLCTSKARPHCSHWYGRLNWKSKLCCLDKLVWPFCLNPRFYVAEIVKKIIRPRHTLPISAVWLSLWRQLHMSSMFCWLVDRPTDVQ